MAKKLVIEGPNGESLSHVPSIKAVKPCGSCILVEMLNPDEALGTKLYVKDDADCGAPQAYIVALGPKLETDLVKVGDRVLLQGTYVPVMNYDGHHRKRGVVEIHNIKAILEENK